MNQRLALVGGGVAALVVVAVGWVWLQAPAPPEPADAPAPVAAPEPPPDPAEHARAPAVAFRIPARRGTTPSPLAADPVILQELARVRGVLEAVVRDHGRDPQNPWAVGHAMLALGADIELTNGETATDWLFSEYAEVQSLGPDELVTFPAKRGEIRIEPHTDLILKALTETGSTPDQIVKVDGRDFTLAELYKYSLWRAWVRGTKTGFQEGSFNDTPWALQGLTSWAPDDLVWLAEGGRKQTMDNLTSSVVMVLHAETTEMRDAMAKGELVKKDTRRGLFRYTCGGQHLLQGAAYAVARGFGSANDKDEICAQLDLLAWRIDVELQAIDPIIATSDRPIQTVLLGQRLKFLGHYLETTHKIAAMEVCEFTPAHFAASERVAVELARTVKALEDLGVFADLHAVRTDASLKRFRQGGPEQVYLDFIGDAAHAVRGIDMATGKGAISY